MNTQKDLVDAPVFESSAILLLVLIGGGSMLFGTVQLVRQKMGLLPFEWYSVAFIVAGLVILGLALLRRRTEADFEREEIRISRTILNLALHARTYSFRSVDGVLLNLELPLEETLDGGFGIVRTRPALSEPEDHYTVALEIGSQQIKVKTTTYYPEARRHAEELAGAIGVMLVDTGTDRAIHTHPDELAS